jgi:response regulator RpfG family c-di-GMP phosphodiesterase
MADAPDLNWCKRRKAESVQVTQTMARDAMQRTNLPPVLYVDTDPQVLKAFHTLLGREFEVQTLSHGAEALAAVESDGPPAVVTDTRLPDMTGADVLSKLRELAPDTSRVLLTGETDHDILAKTVNDGQTFRLLRKHCTVATLVNALCDGVQQYRHASTRRELLDKTVIESIDALSDVLGLVNPLVYARWLPTSGFAIAGRSRRPRCCHKSATPVCRQ